MKIRFLQSGLTLIELMIGLGVVAILGTVAGPSFRDMILSTQITSATNEFISALAYARSEAVKRAAIVRVDAVGGDWANGWQIINNADNTVIREFSAPSSTVTLAPSDIDGAVITLSFDGRGLLVGKTNGVTADVCHASGMKGRQISLSATGRPQLNRHYDCP